MGASASIPCHHVHMSFTYLCKCGNTQETPSPEIAPKDLDGSAICFVCASPGNDPDVADALDETLGEGMDVVMSEGSDAVEVKAKVKASSGKA